ncbi:HNH endonuclease signature motif containing protein [Microbacterium arborescens]|uniref:HNH endonuclease signature motif containing protein n=1 Tax=Microbacterium arborescens TaxID=33883 RepID=UPI001F07C288|nr:HNH endonuclease signature motif containing protein [Microbacterium arborescens]
MTTNGESAHEPDAGSSSSPYAGIVGRVSHADDLLHAANIAMTRALAEAGRSALRQAARSGERPRGRGSDMEMRSIAAEIAGVRRSHDRRAQNEIDHALTIVDDYPAVFEAWEQQRITRDHVDVVVRMGCGLADDIRDDYARQAISICERDIASRVREPLRNLAARMGSESFAERHRTAAAKRGVWVTHGTDGMSEFGATLPTVIAAGIHDRLTAMAQSVKDARAAAGEAPADAAAGDAASGEGSAAADAAAPADGGTPDVRTMDQLRADTLGDLLLGGAPVVDPTYGSDAAGPLGAIRAQVQVTLTSETVTGVDDAPAELVGASLIDADTARKLASRAKIWNRLFIDPITRTPVEVDTYRPTAAMSRLLKARDQHCRFPGCRRAAIRCELDHTIDYALGGHTHIFNLAHLCQRHHSMKQFTKWEVRQIGGGALEWTSPLGRVYREDVPIPSVCFVPDTGAAPPPGAGSDEPPPF